MSAKILDGRVVASHLWRELSGPRPGAGGCRRHPAAPGRCALRRARPVGRVRRQPGARGTERGHRDPRGGATGWRAALRPGGPHWRAQPRPGHLGHRCSPAPARPPRHADGARADRPGQGCGWRHSAQRRAPGARRPSLRSRDRAGRDGHPAHLPDPGRRQAGGRCRPLSRGRTPGRFPPAGGRCHRRGHPPSHPQPGARDPACRDPGGGRRSTRPDPFRDGQPLGGGDRLRHQHHPRRAGGRRSTSPPCVRSSAPSPRCPAASGRSPP